MAICEKYKSRCVDMNIIPFISISVDGLNDLFKYSSLETKTTLLNVLSFNIRKRNLASLHCKYIVLLETR